MKMTEHEWRRMIREEKDLDPIGFGCVLLLLAGIAALLIFGVVGWLL